MSDTRPDTLFALTALSPLDGRYAAKTDKLRDCSPKPASCTIA